MTVKSVGSRSRRRGAVCTVPAAPGTAEALDATVAEIEARTPSTPGAPCVAYNDPAPPGCVLAL